MRLKDFLEGIGEELEDATITIKTSKKQEQHENNEETRIINDLDLYCGL